MYCFPHMVQKWHSLWWFAKKFIRIYFLLPLVSVLLLSLSFLFEQTYLDIINACLKHWIIYVLFLWLPVYWVLYVTQVMQDLRIVCACTHEILNNRSAYIKRTGINEYAHLYPKAMNNLIRDFSPTWRVICCIVNSRYIALL